MGGGGDLDHAEAVAVGVEVVAGDVHAAPASPAFVRATSSRATGADAAWAAGLVIAIDENIVARAMTRAMPDVRACVLLRPSPVAFDPIPLSHPPDVGGHFRASHPGKREVDSAIFRDDRWQRSGPHEQRDFHSSQPRGPFPAASAEQYCSVCR